MAYYTVAHLLHAGSYDASQPGPLAIRFPTYLALSQYIYAKKSVSLCLVKLVVMTRVVSVLWFAFYRDPVNFVDVNSVGPFVLGRKTQPKSKRSFHPSHAPYSAKKIVELD